MFGRKKKQYEDEEYDYDDYEDDDEYDDDAYEEYEDDDEYEDQETYEYRQDHSLLNEIKQLEEEKSVLIKDNKNARKKLDEQGEELNRVLLKLSRVEEIKLQHSSLQESYGALQETYAKEKADLEEAEKERDRQAAELLTVKAELAAAKAGQVDAEQRLATMEKDMEVTLSQSKQYEAQASQLTEVGAVLLEAKNQARQIVLEAQSEAEGIRLMAERDARNIHDKAAVKLQVIRKEAETIQQSMEIWRDSLTNNLDQLVEKSRYVLSSRERREEEEQ